jgi:hypothetical protein
LGKTVWKLHNERLNALARSEAARDLHQLLCGTFGGTDHRLPEALRGHKPFVLARDFGRDRWIRPSDHAHADKLYWFQFGPRKWSKPIYTYAGHRVSDRAPEYEREAKTLAKTLTLAGWERVAARVLSTERKTDELGGLQITLCWQQDGRFLVIGDREKQLAIAFQWNDDGLVLLGEAHPRRFASEAPIVSLDKGMVTPKPGEKAGRMEEFIRAVEWQYATKLDLTLDSLLVEGCERMREIDGDVGIVYAGHRFNDAGHDDNWLAVRCGNFAWENGVYFQRNAQSLRSAPAEIHSLLDLLVHLRSSGLSQAFNACYGYHVRRARRARPVQAGGPVLLRLRQFPGFLRAGLRDRPRYRSVAALRLLGPL